MLALLFALAFLKASIFVTITAMTHFQTSVQISFDVSKSPFVIRSNLIQENDGPRVSHVSCSVKTTTRDDL